MRAVAGAVITAALVWLLLGCVHTAPGLPKGHPAPVINTDRPGTLSR